MAWLEVVNLFLLTVTMVGIIWLAATFWNASNGGIVERRFAHLMSAIAFLFVWAWIARMDSTFDVVPGLGLITYFRLFIWIPYGIITVTVFRLWQAIRAAIREDDQGGR